MTTPGRVGFGADGAALARRRQGAHVNIDEGERWLSLVGGCLLLVFGLSRGGRAGAAAALCGSALIYRAARGRSQPYEARCLDSAPTHVARSTSRSTRRGVTVRRT